jgi:hypothetical protein
MIVLIMTAKPSLLLNLRKPEIGEADFHEN